MAKRKPTQCTYLLRIFDFYHGSVNRPCSMKEVAEWGIANELYPTPQARSDDAVIIEWEAKFRTATSRPVNEIEAAT